MPEAAFEPELRERLDEFAARLMAWNKKFSLTAVPDDQIYQQLIAPSAWLGLRYAREDIGRVVDFGCGPGIPGVPMALADRRNRYLVVDSNGRKIGFVKQAILALGMENIEAEQIRLSPGEWDRGAVDRLVTRGTGSYDKIVKLWRGKLKPGGVIDFFKSVKEAPPPAHELDSRKIDTPDWFGSLQLVRVRV